MQLLKFNQLTANRIYMMHGKTEDTRWLFRYIGGTMNASHMMDKVIYFKDNYTKAPTRFDDARIRLDGSDYNTETNPYLKGYEDITGSMLADYYTQADSGTFIRLWENFIEPYLAQVDDPVPTINHFKFLP